MLLNYLMDYATNQLTGQQILLNSIDCKLPPFLYPLSISMEQLSIRSINS